MDLRGLSSGELNASVSCSAASGLDPALSRLSEESISVLLPLAERTTLSSSSSSPPERKAPFVHVCSPFWCVRACHSTEIYC